MKIKLLLAPVFLVAIGFSYFYLFYDYTPENKEEVSQIIAYGQSLSLGASTHEIISNVQNNNNITFNFGPTTKDKIYKIEKFFPVIPLIEKSSNGFNAKLGETVCSETANYSSEKLGSEHKILCSTAGKGDTRISDLLKGTKWYNFIFKKQMEAGSAYSDGTVLKAVPWLQGEADATNKTSYKEYRDMLSSLASDINKDAMMIYNQKRAVNIITYQMSYKVLEHPDIAKAQLSLAKEKSNHIYLSTPTYILPYNKDKVHLTADGYYILGAYIGKVYSSLEAGNTSEIFHPLSAKVLNKEIIVKFNVPEKPIVIDTKYINRIEDYGVLVTDESGNKVKIKSISTTDSGDELVISTFSPAKTGWHVRFGLDYPLEGIKMGSGTNIRDSAKDSIILKGKVINLWNFCPHDQLAVN